MADTAPRQDPVERHAEAPINRLLGDGTSCRRIAKDVSVHWYPSTAEPGDMCWCGEAVMRDREFDDDDE